MKPFLRIPLCALSLAAALATVNLSAQGTDPNPAQNAVPAAPEISAFLGNLADQPPMHLGFVFDRSMLQAARGLLQSGGLSADRAAAALSSISYDNYRYAQPAVYAPETMESIAAAYRSAHWKHLVNAHEPAAGTSAQRTATDLWLHFSGSDIDGVTVLTRGVRDVNVVQIACDLRPLDLIHLGGHFGIPKVDPNAVMVPAPDGR
jgi:hypothetical protein